MVAETTPQVAVFRLSSNYIGSMLGTQMEFENTHENMNTNII